MNAPSLRLNNPLSALGCRGKHCPSTSQCFSFTNKLNSIEILSVRTVHGPFLVSNCCYKCLCSHFMPRCFAKSPSKICTAAQHLFIQPFVEFSDSHCVLSPQSPMLLLTLFSRGQKLCWHRPYTSPQASFLPDLVHCLPLRVLFAEGREEGGSTINK